MFTFIIGDDWQGLYFNNDLILENHDLEAYQTLVYIRDYVRKNKINIDYNYFNIDIYYIDQDWMEDSGSLPDKFKNIPKCKLYQ